jgi:hypothetical protein
MAHCYQLHPTIALASGFVLHRHSIIAIRSSPFGYRWMDMTAIRAHRKYVGKISGTNYTTRGWAFSAPINHFLEQNASNFIGLCNRPQSAMIH